MAQFDPKSSLDARGTPESNRLEFVVYRQLLEQIHSGKYPYGHKLPTENELAAEFKVSRPVIRSALARLRDDKLIVSRRGAGSFVNSGKPETEQAFTPLRSIKDISSYWEFRALIESEAASLAARKRSEEQMQQLRHIHNKLGTEVENGGPTVELNAQLHSVIGDMAGNHFFNDAFRLLKPQMEFVGNLLRSLSIEKYLSNKETMHIEHATILNAIEAKDSEAARQAMMAHIKTSQRRVFEGE